MASYVLEVIINHHGNCDDHYRINSKKINVYEQDDHYQSGAKKWSGFGLTNPTGSAGPDVPSLSGHFLNFSHFGHVTS